MNFSTTDSGAIVITFVSRIDSQKVRTIPFDVPATGGYAGSYIIDLAENGPYLKGLEQTRRDEIISKVKTFVNNDPYMKKLPIGERWINPSADEVVRDLSSMLNHAEDVKAVRKSIRKLDIDLE